MSAERDRLEKVYAGFGDEELLKLDADKESLTDDAGAALAAVMQARGLKVAGHSDTASGPEAGIPGVLPGMEAMEKALDRSGEIEMAGLAELISFMDGHELGRAVGFLKEAEIAFELRTASEDALKGAPPSFHILVKPQKVEEGQSLLRETMGLFPLQEVSEQDADLDDGTLQELGSFETMADAEQAMTILAAKGVESKVIEPTDPTDPNDWFVVLVKTGEFARALQVLVDGLGMIE
jgi:hypothetical protein